MPPKIYEIRTFRDGREVRNTEPFLTGLDLDDAETIADLLNRHLLGSVLRSGARRTEAHLFQLEIRDVNHQGKGIGQPLFRWALPAEGAR